MKIWNLMFIGLFLFGLSGCKKDSNSGTLSPDIENTPSALASNNNSSAGVYKGVMVGSSGYFKISIQNGTADINCEFNFDGKSATLTTNSLANWTPGQAITNAVFTGTWNEESVSLTFSCDADGSNPVITVSVPDHTVNVTVYKETSTVLVKCYEGTYSTNRGTEIVNGVFNFVAYGNAVLGWHHDSHSSEGFSATISGNTLTLSQPAGAALTITDTTVSGSFHDDSNYVTTVTGHRSM